MTVAAHFAMLHIDNVVESKTNPRKHFGALDELAASVREKGVLQPVKARPVNGHFELVYGARRFRAAKAVGLKELPALVQEMSDKEVLEEQIVENSQREDVPPLEEAEGYRELIEKHGYTADDLAAKVGKSKRVIYERLQLCKLGKEGRKALDEERLNASVALLVARIPAELQAAAVKDIAASDDHDAGLSYRAAVEHIHDNYMLQLKDAPFELTDAKLVAKAGACSTCPKRTGNQRELFAEVKSADVCTDPKCYRSKEDALWQIKVKEAEKSGQKVLGAAETKKVFPYEHTDTPAYGSPFAALDQEEYVGGKMRKVSEILGKDAPPPVLARAPSGKIVELTSRELVQKKVRELEPKQTTSSSSGGRSSQAAERKKLDLRKKVVAATMERIVAGVQKLADEKVLRFIVRAMASSYGYLHVDALAVETRRKVSATALRAAAKEGKADVLRGLGVELLASHTAAGNMWSGGYGDGFKAAAELAGVDLKKAETELQPGKAKKPAPGKACAIPGCGEPGKRVKGSPGLWCKDHGEKLSASERKSIADRNKRLAGQLPAKAKGGKAAAGKAKKK